MNHLRHFQILTPSKLLLQERNAQEWQVCVFLSLTTNEASHHMHQSESCKYNLGHLETNVEIIIKCRQLYHFSVTSTAETQSSCMSTFSGSGAPVRSKYSTSITSSTPIFGFLSSSVTPSTSFPINCSCLITNSSSDSRRNSPPMRKSNSTSFSVIPSSAS